MKTAKKGKKAAETGTVAGAIAPAEDETATEAPSDMVVAPDDFQPLPQARDNIALAGVLLEAELIDPDMTEGIRDVVEALTDEQFDDVAVWVRECLWLMEEGNDVPPVRHRAVRASRIRPPAILAGRLHPEMVDIAAMIDNQFFVHQQLLLDEMDEAKYQPEDEAPLAGADGQLPLVQEDFPLPTARPPILTMRTKDESAQIAGAIKDRAADLMNLAKKAKDLEQHREARHFENLAKSLTNHLLPQLEAQTTLALDEATPILSTLANSFGETVYAAFHQHCIKTAHPRDGESTEDAVARTRDNLRDIEKILGKLPQFMAPTALEYFTAIAEEAQAAGYAQRTETAEYLVRKAVHGIRLAKQQEAA